MNSVSNSQSSMSTRIYSPVIDANQLSLRRLLLLFVGLVAFSFSALAQQATIVGTVTDPSGAALPSVTVTVTSTESSAVRTLQTNTTGQYVAADLNIGHYTVKAELSGFKAEQKAVLVQVGDRDRVDFQMQVGGAQETITVEANPVQIQTDTGEQSNVITGQQISQLAVSGRSMYQLAALVPGASSQIGGGGMSAGVVNTPVGGDASVEFNGMRQNHNIYMLDGGEDDDRGGAGGMSIAPSSDAIAEFRTLTSNYSADYGLSSAGTMTMVLKSGTNTLHASAWEFNRNDALDARNYFNPAPQKVSELRLNVFGFNVGGPVTLGKLYNPERKRTFFFYNMEWRRLIQGGLTNQPVPDPSTYGGNFGSTLINVPTAADVSASVLAKNCPGGQLPTGIVQGSPFPNNTIPSCMIAPNATALVNAGIFPAPNTVDATGKPVFIGGNNSPTDLKEEVARIDHNLNNKVSLFGHFISEQVSQTFGVSQWSNANVPTVGDTFGNPSYSAVVHATYSISSTLLNETAFNYNGNRINIVPFAGSGLKSLTIPSGYNSTNSRLFTGPNNDSRIPNIDLNGSVGSKFEISSWPWHNKADDYQVRDDLSWTKGAHQLKMGGSWALYKKVQDLFGQTQGAFNFDGTFSGSDFADFLLGNAKSYTELAVQDHGFWNNLSWAAYFQDNWRVNRNLTLNLGVRWDGVPHTYEANNRMGNFYPSLYNPPDAAVMLADGTISPSSPGLGASPNPILANVPLYLNGIGIPGQNGVPKGLVNSHWLNFGPRFGFAYDPVGNGRTVVRGGFGIMYERIQGNDMYNAGPNIPFSLSVTNNSVTMADPGILLSTGAAGAKAINPASITGLAVNEYKQPASYQYSAGVQRQLNSRTVLSVAYVGNQNRYQNDYREINLPNESYLGALVGGAQYNTAPGLPYPGFHSIDLSTNEANTHYNSLQADLTSHIRDLTLRAYYTLSRAIDPTTAGNGGGDLGNVSNPYLGWKYDEGPSGYDRTHNAAVNFIYDIPFLRNSSNRLLKGTIGGWEVSGIITMTSGVPINPQLTGGQSGNGLPNATNRPDQVSGASYPHTVAEWFNTNAFQNPAIGAWGNAGHNSLRGPGRDNWNLSLFKSFIIDEARGSRFELRAESFNTWNHTEFNQVSNALGSNNFGQVTSAFDPRVFQLGAKLYF